MSFGIPQTNLNLTIPTNSNVSSPIPNNPSNNPKSSTDYDSFNNFLDKIKQTKDSILGKPIEIDADGRQNGDITGKNVKVTSQANYLNIGNSNTGTNPTKTTNVTDLGGSNIYNFLNPNQIFNYDNTGAPPPNIDGDGPGDNYKINVGNQAQGSTINIDSPKTGIVDLNDAHDININFKNPFGKAILTGKGENIRVINNGAVDVKSFDGAKSSIKGGKIYAQSGQNKTINFEPADGEVNYENVHNNQTDRMDYIKYVNKIVIPDTQ